MRLRRIDHVRIALRTRNLRAIGKAIAGRPFLVVYIADDDGSRARPRRPWMDDPAWQPSGRAPVGNVVRFAPDYCADLPLWGISWHEPNLPRDLLVRLTEWQETFDAHFDPESGWDSTMVKDEWAADGRSLEAEVREALGSAYVLEADWWPLQANMDEPD
jgi:hypothetical protein